MNNLKGAADDSKVPATVLAQAATEAWLRQRSRKARHSAIAAFAADAAGTFLDLDGGLQAAGIEHLIHACMPSR